MQLIPPWNAHPEIPFGSIGWRMGRGEDYWLEFQDRYLAMPSENRDAYRDLHPEPAEWNGFYALLRGR